MTGEEAKNWLHKLYARADITDEYGDMEDMQPYEEAINMAISALSENKGDLISRQAVEDITWEEPSYFDPLNVLTEVREKVRALPSVENKGEWRPIYQGDEIIDYRCNKCDFGSTFGRGIYRFNFCPNCGAKMKGGE